VNLVRRQAAFLNFLVEIRASTKKRRRNIGKMAPFICSQSIGSLSGACWECVAFRCGLTRKACSKCSESSSQALYSPFSPYLIATFMLNIPPTVWAVLTLVEAPNCGGSDPRRSIGWLSCNGLVTFLHIVCALYIVHRMQRHRSQICSLSIDTASSPTQEKQVVGPSAGEPETIPAETDAKNECSGVPASTDILSAPYGHEENDEGDETTYHRCTKSLCYDGGIAIYLFFVIWLIGRGVGASAFVIFNRMPSDNDATEYEESCDQLKLRVALSLALGYMYLSLVCIAFGYSVFCARKAGIS
jgi:hypothetical protein